MISADWEGSMKKKTSAEQELLAGFDAESAHTNELATLRPQELTPLERLKGSVICYEQPLDSVWDDEFDSDEAIRNDFMEDREYQLKGRE